MTTKRIGLAFGAVGAAALAGFGLAVKATADFEKRLSFLQAITKGTPAQMEKVRQSAFKLSQQFGITANEVADAFVELGKAGVTIPQLTGGVAKATIELARAADITASEAATTIVNITKSFHLVAKDATHIADVLAGAANASTVDITDLAFSMKYAGATAHAMGIPLESVADALALLGNNGIRGSTAGTSLRRMLIQLTGPTDTSRAALEKLGIITKDGANQFFNASGKMRSLANISQILQQSTRKLSREQKAQAFNTIFGARALASALILTKEGAKGFAKMHKEVGRTTAYQVAQKRLDNLAGAIDKFRAALHVALIQSGAPAQKPLIQLVHWLTSLVKAFGRLDPGTQQTIVKFVLITGVIFTLASAFMLLTSFVFRLWQTFLMISEMKNAFMGLKFVEKVLYELRFAFLRLSESMLALLANPVVLTIAALALLGIAAYELYQHWAPFRNLINNLGKWFIWLGKTIVGGLKGAFDWVKAHGAQIAAALVLAFLPISVPIAALIVLIYEFLHHWRGVWTAAQAVAGAFSAAWKVFWKINVAVFKAAWLFIGPAVKTELGAMIAMFKFALAIIKTLWKTAWAIIKGVTLLVWHLIVNIVKVGTKVIVDLVNVVADILDGKWSKAWHDAGKLLSDVFKGIWHILSGFFDDAGKLLINAGKALVFGLMHGITSVAKDLYHTVKKNMVDDPISWVKKGLHIGSPSRDFIDMGESVGLGFAVGIDNMQGAIARALAGITNMVTDTLRHVANAVTSFLNWSVAASSQAAGAGGAAARTKMDRLAAEADARSKGSKVPKPAGHYGFNLPNLDLSGAGGGDFGADGGGGSGSKKKKAAAKQKRVDLRLLFQSGQWIMDGFRKGMESGAKGVRTFMKSLQHRILSYLNKAKAYGDKAGERSLEKLDRQVTRYGNHLLRLAQHRDNVIKKIDKQQKHLDKILTAKADYAKAVRDSILALGEINAVVTKVDAAGNPDVTAENIVQGLQTTVDAVKEYDKELAQLLAMGLSKKQYDQLVQEGPEAGGAYARALLDGGPETIKQVNKLEEELRQEAIKMGKKTSETMYNAGIKTARGIIQGLRDKKGEIAAIMREVAHEMVKTLKKELGIKSPSRVMMDMGRMTTRGYAMGLLAEIEKVRKNAAIVSRAAIPDASSLSTRGAGVSAASLRVSATLPDDYSRPAPEINQYIKSTEPKKAADESARKLRTIAQMGAFG